MPPDVDTLFAPTNLGMILALHDDGVSDGAHRVIVMKIVDVRLSAESHVSPATSYTMFRWV
jgi:hypothetical protein